MSLANLRLQDQLRDQSVRDPLTGLFNRRYLERELSALAARSSQTGTSYAVIQLDIDHFKRINDAWGHQAGDAVLQAVGNLLLERTREHDVVCRYGGEEFTVLLPDTPRDAARARAELLREAMEEMDVLVQGTVLPKVTLSAGVTCDVGAQTAAAALHAADVALYAAKAAGRNRVHLAFPTERQLIPRQDGPPAALGGCVRRAVVLDDALQGGGAPDAIARSSDSVCISAAVAGDVVGARMTAQSPHEETEI
jgi:diguanylate cyclase (GGDEF)-like protein